MRAGTHLVAVVAVLLLVAVTAPVGAQRSADTLSIIKTDQELSNADIALELAMQTPSHGPRVVIARDDAFADALASGVLQDEAPLLLVPTDGPIPEGVQALLEDRPAREAMILGGTAAVSQTVQDSLDAAGVVTVRLAGSTRFDTAVEIARFAAPAADTVLLARAFGAAGVTDPSQAFADSIAAGGLSGANGWPVLLTDTDSLTPVTREYLTGPNRPVRVRILGGTAAVSQAVEDEMAGLGLVVDRIAGPNRFDTAVAVARESGATSAADVARVVLVEGTGPDAWAGGFAAAHHAITSAGEGFQQEAGRRPAPIVLGAGSQLPPATATFLQPGIGGDPQAAPVLTCVVSPELCERARVQSGLPPAGFKAIHVSAGLGHTCAIDPDGTARCWGINDSGQLGTSPVGTHATSPQPVVGGMTFTTIAAGIVHTCGITIDGTAHCWGSNAEGQLGDGTTAEVPSSVPQPVAGGLTFADITAGQAHTCGIALDGTAHCWGRNGSGQLGDGTGADATTPQPVAGGLNFTDITAGALHTCGIATDGAAHCWGINDSGQLGDDSIGDASTPQLVVGGLNFTTITAGQVHTCGIAIDGAAHCWGVNSHGQLGNSATAEAPTPQAVAGGLTFSTIAAAQRHTCAIAADGTAHCWGRNAEGQLGNGTTADAPSVPQTVAGGLTFTTITAGWDHTCGIAADGTAHCWGRNETGQLGNDTTGATTPQPVVG